jgi:hypothetical protein
LLNAAAAAATAILRTILSSSVSPFQALSWVQKLSFATSASDGELPEPKKTQSKSRKSHASSTKRPRFQPKPHPKYKWVDVTDSEPELFAEANAKGNSQGAPKAGPSESTAHQARPAPEAGPSESTTRQDPRAPEAGPSEPTSHQPTCTEQPKPSPEHKARLKAAKALEETTSWHQLVLHILSQFPHRDFIKRKSLYGVEAPGYSMKIAYHKLLVVSLGIVILEPY